LDTAQTGFEQALVIHPDSVDALRGLAGLALERGQIARALELHNKLLALGERTPEFLYNLALLQQQSGNPLAAKHYEEALSLAPNFPEALLNLGLALQSLGRDDEARVSWKKAIDPKPELALGYFQ